MRKKIELDLTLEECESLVSSLAIADLACDCDVIVPYHEDEKLRESAVKLISHLKTKHDSELSQRIGLKITQSRGWTVAQNALKQAAVLIKKGTP